MKKFGKLFESYVERENIEVLFLNPKGKAGKLETAGLGVVAAFSIGSLWVVVGAYAINADRLLVWSVITPSAITAGTDLNTWIFGDNPFLPSPWLLYFVAAEITIYIVHQNYDQIRRQ